MITFIPNTFASEVAGTGMSCWDELEWSLYLKSITCLENPMEGMSDIYKSPIYYIKQSNPTHPLRRNQSPSPEKN
jgi:hypothetical protein